MLGDDLKGTWKMLINMRLRDSLTELLPVMDNIERAYGAIDIQNDDQKSIGEGLELTIKNFVEVFKKINISVLIPKVNHSMPNCIKQ